MNLLNCDSKPNYILEMKNQDSCLWYIDCNPTFFYLTFSFKKTTVYSKIEPNAKHSQVSSELLVWEKVTSIMNLDITASQQSSSKVDFCVAFSQWIVSLLIAICLVIPADKWIGKLTVLRSRRTVITVGFISVTLKTTFYFSGVLVYVKMRLNFVIINVSTTLIFHGPLTV